VTVAILDWDLLKAQLYVYCFDTKSTVSWKSYWV